MPPRWCPPWARIPATLSCASAPHGRGREASAAQLAPSGRLFAVVGEAPAMGAQIVTCTAPGAYGTVTLFETVLKPLVNAEHPPRFRF